MQSVLKQNYDEDRTCRLILISDQQMNLPGRKNTAVKNKPQKMQYRLGGRFS